MIIENSPSAESTGTDPGRRRTDDLSPDPALPTNRVQMIGSALVVGAMSWGVALTCLDGVDGFGAASLLTGIAALMFQAALLGLLHLQYRDRAMTGKGGAARVARIGYTAQAVVLAGAMVSTTLDAFWLIQGSLVWTMFDSCWPLSMLGMLIIGIRVAIAGRWHGALRWQTLFAQSWLVWGIPLSALGFVGSVLGGAQIVLGYGVLGGLLVAWPARGRTASTAWSHDR